MSLTTVRVQSRPKSDVAKRPRWWWAVVQLTSIAFFIPLSRLSGSQRALTDATSAVIVGLGVCLAGIALYLAWSRFTSAWRGLAYATTCLVFFWQWGAWASQGKFVSWLVSAALLGIVLMAVRRWAEHSLFQVAALVISTTLSVTALALILADLAQANPPSLASEPIGDLGPPARTPDVVLLVLDSYARADVLQDDFSYNNSEFIAGLEEAGFQIPDSANANYTMTHLSIPSLMSMAYLDNPDHEIRHADLRRLESLTSGKNVVVESLKDSGYSYVHGSADNWLNHCTDVADVCLPGPTVDQTMFALLQETPVGPLLHPTWGDPTTALNRERIEQLRTWDLEALGLAHVPTFSYLHLGLPHPPLFLNSECAPRVHHNLSGQLINFLSMSPEVLELRKSAYVDQVRCANTTVMSLLERLQGDEVVIITADHGPDSHGLLNADPRTWSQEQIHERLAIFTALRLPATCSSPLDPNLQLVNVFRVVFNCLYPSADLPMLEPEYRASSFGGPIIRLDDPDGITAAP